MSKITILIEPDLAVLNKSMIYHGLRANFFKCFTLNSAFLASAIGNSEMEEAMEELDEEKKIRAMVEKQRDEALKSVEDLRDSLVEARNKNKVVCVSTDADC